MAGNGGTLDVGGRSVKLTNLDKVLYPATGTTKAEILQYYLAVSARILPLLRELEIGLVPYAPLGRGFLTGTLASTDMLADDDFRRHDPRMSGTALDANAALVDAVRAMAADKGITAGQLALAWVLAQGPDVVPIPGTKRVAYLDENVAADAVALSASDLAALAAAVPRDAVVGARYADMSSIDS